MVEFGLYIIKDDFFKKYNDKYLKGNKKENRPHYCCFKDSYNDELFWVIPLSHQVNKYKKLMQQAQNKNQRCDKIHILKMAGGESVFLIQDMFPITDKYIEREYTLNSIPFVIKNPDDIAELTKKSKRILRLIYRNVKYMPTQANVLKIKEELLKEQPKNVY